jgi:hypothetical protein
MLMLSSIYVVCNQLVLIMILVGIIASNACNNFRKEKVLYVFFDVFKSSILQKFEICIYPSHLHLLFLSSIHDVFP